MVRIKDIGIGDEMTTQSKAKFQVTGWDEKPYEEEKGTPKLTKATVTNTFSGDIEGTGLAEYLMAYPTADTATFVGLQRITGSLRGEQGAFVLQLDGTFENGLVKADWSVVPNSGTGKLKGLSGKGGFETDSEMIGDVRLNYNLG